MYPQILRLITRMHLLSMTLADTTQAKLAKLTSQRERGSETIQVVLFAVAAIVFVGIVVVAIKTYLNNQVGKIK